MTKLYCICRSKNHTGFMIACELCDEWFHGRCIGITKKASSSIENYYCDACRAKNPTLKIEYKDDEDYTPLTERRTDTSKSGPSKEHSQERKTHRESSILAPQISRSSQPQTKSAPGKRRAGQKSKSKGHARKQCANPECIYESRSESKYCSDECGLSFNRLRYEKFFIPKWASIKDAPSQAKLLRFKERMKLEEDRDEALASIKSLRLENEELQRNIAIIKEQAKKMCKESAISKENVDDEAESDSDDVEETTAGELFCVTCGMKFKSDITFKHWSTCHRKHEASYAFTADLKINYSCDEDPDPKLYCYTQDKKTKRYCMHLATACPQHASWQGEKDEVCGCPLDIQQKLVPDGNYCLEMKRDCNQHYQWDKFRLAQMNMMRIQAFSRLDFVNEKIRNIDERLKDSHGGVIGIMLHNTTNHTGGDDLPCYDQDDIDVDMTTD